MMSFHLIYAQADIEIYKKGVEVVESTWFDQR